MHGVIALSGYDPRLVMLLPRVHARWFVASALCSAGASIVVGLGGGYGMWLATDSGWVAAAVGVALALVFLNLYRLLHAGTGFPTHWPIDALAWWTPSWVSVAVFVVLGSLLGQPAVVWCASMFDRTTPTGLLAQLHALWRTPMTALLWSTVLMVLTSLPAWFRRVHTSAVRAYEQQRWLDERMLVDDAFADGQEQITQLLARVPGFAPPLQLHYADPPYNTRALVFGLELHALDDGRSTVRADDDGVAPATAAPARSAPIVVPAAVPLPPLQPQEEAATTSLWDSPEDDAKTAAPAHDFLAMGRAQSLRAQQHIDAVTPFLARHLDLPEAQVRERIGQAAAHARVHAIFPEYKSLRTVLLKDAGYALDAGLAPILAIVTQRTVAEVERRLRAAPRDQRLAGVFTSELARRLLKQRAS